MAKKKTTRRKVSAKKKTTKAQWERDHEERERAREEEQRRRELAQILAFVDSLAKGAPAVYLAATLGRACVADAADFESPSQDGLKRAEDLLDFLEDVIRVLGNHLATVDRQGELDFGGEKEGGAS